ncbi:MAG: hypothetical protein H7259_00340 [Cytophagales bacterium]|nr:hypothetical protein [Cytophaga sp.]
MEYSLSKISTENHFEIEQLSLKNGGNPNLSEKYINHWYYNNPSKSRSLWKVLVGGIIEGFATTNNFVFQIEHTPVLIAMPQNLLTSIKIRGKGFFEKLYKETEHENIENNKAESFIVFSNELSSPIFLNKLGYVKAKCPPVIFSFFNPLDFFSTPDYKRIYSFDDINNTSVFSFDNAMQKTYAHLQWRYACYSATQLHMIEVKKEGAVTGYAFLKVEKKKGISFLILMDIMTENKDAIHHIIDTCYRYASRNFFAGLVLFDIPGFVPKRTLRCTFNNRFNVLVKSKAQESTIRLSKVPFCFFFGDLDIV